VDAASSPLKHWGLQIAQALAAVTGGGSIVWEYQIRDPIIILSTGWQPFAVMSVSEAEHHRYADQTFLRAASDEIVRFGLDDTTSPSWTTSLINGTTGHWIRMRIDSTVTTLPTFERFRLCPSQWRINAQGQPSALGLAQWRSELAGIGNVFGTTSGTANGTLTVGSGGIPTGWTHEVPKGKLNSNGDDVSFQFALPDGICTAFGLSFTLTYVLEGSSPVTAAADVILSALVLGSGGVLIADAAGGVVPVARAATAAEALTSKAAHTETLSTPTGAIGDRPQTLRWEGVDISAHYSGDQVLVRLELDNDGTPNQDLVVLSLQIGGVRFTQGRRL
jgi:hypothetical protein